MGSFFLASSRLYTIVSRYPKIQSNYVNGLNSNFSGRGWHTRRVVYTIDVIAFTLPTSDSVIDAIPLFEVEEVVKMTGDEGRIDDNSISGKQGKKGGGKRPAEEEKLPDGNEKKSGDSNKVKFRNALQIQTKSDGYNSGRQYIIQARSEEERKGMVENLTKLSKTATEQFLAKSQFAKAQASPAPASARAPQHRCGMLRQTPSRDRRNPQPGRETYCPPTSLAIAPTPPPAARRHSLRL